MQDNFNTFSKIEDYLNGNLSEVERSAFEKELATNPELQNLVDDYSLVDVLIEQNEIVSINNKLTNIHKKRVLTRNIFKGFLGLILIAFVVAYFFIPKNYPVGEKIEIKKEESKSIAFLESESTPFKIMDSMSEVKLTSSIKLSKGISESSPDIDSIISETNLPIELPQQIDSLPPKKVDSVKKT